MQNMLIEMDAFSEWGWGGRFFTISDILSFNISLQQPFNFTFNVFNRLNEEQKLISRNTYTQYRPSRNNKNKKTNSNTFLDIRFRNLRVRTCCNGGVMPCGHI